MVEQNNQTIDLSHLLLSIKDRGGEVFSGKVHTVSSVNSIGPFDILPLHANMVTTIQEKIIVQPTSGGQKNIPIKNGLLRVTKNNVEIFLGL